VNYYYDASALVANYHEEAGSRHVESLLAEPDARHLISRFGYLEVQSAFALKVRTGEITEADFQLLRRRFRGDLKQKRLVVVRLLRRHFDQSERLLLAHSLRERLRTADALHLAIALDLRETGIAEAFVCSDAPLVAVARAEGMTVVNPLEV
jgi:predicted nucleic acid-binding protein